MAIVKILVGIEQGLLAIVLLDRLDEILQILDELTLGDMAAMLYINDGNEVLRIGVDISGQIFNCSRQSMLGR